MNKKVTFKEVAELAGVSTQTVSRVTNGGGGVNANTLKKVQEAIDQLGYVPNKGAQLLVRKKAKVFGVITLEMTMEGASSIVNGIRLESEKAGYAISIAVSNSEEENLENAIRELKSQQVDVVFINLPVQKELAENLVAKHKHLPFLFIDVSPEANVSQVAADHYKGAVLIAELMLKHGRKRFALLNGPAHSHAANLRKQAWLDVLKPSDAEIVTVETGDWSAKSGYYETTKLLLQPQNIDTLLVGNDQMALGALRACAEQKYAVPDQIAVTGFDDTVNSAYYNPPLTTVHQNFLEIGKQAVKQILIQLKNENNISKMVIPVQLIERQSTMPVKENLNSVKEIKDLLQKIQTLLPNS
ncbi:LacI family DNA-binding transcriptional regulator [Polaribacter sp. AHE13PA]|uniref:LacI family DNA-binding transcriptional regulator n=1 Tax=Polaribacter sp. AHE13PA TaxID=2745562 RepID=UPI001C500DF4|nr:LacI family DNA-binding transcriptional regulator [Polaribacter sp. AHE13PA]QXP68015.1 substrate-binding domain-containing protein [Polaribacter sp. AHE13PA]